MLKQRLRRRARYCSASFGACYRGIIPGPQQWEMSRRCDNKSILYQADFWPRDHGKTEIFVNDLPLREICEDPNIRILIVQKTGTEARKAISVIKTELEQNEQLRTDYADHWLELVGADDIVNKTGMVDNKTGSWGAQRIYVKRTRRGKDPTVEAVGVGGAITGGHFNLIICDDILDDENTKNEARCQSIINWFFGTILQLREPDTKIIVVGTLKTMLENIYSIISENPIWNTSINSAILSHTIDEIDYTPHYEIIDGKTQITGVTVHTPNVRVMWPEEWPIEALIMDMLGSPHRIWRREKLNDLSAMSEKIFKKHYFRYYDLDDQPPYRAVLQSWDTAFKETAGAAFSVMSEWGHAQNGLFLRNLFRQKLEWSELSMAIPLLYLLAPIRPQAVLIEDKASGQSAIQEWRHGRDREAWLVELKRYMSQPGAKREIVSMIEQILTMQNLPEIIHVPVMPIVVGSEADKIARAEDASVWYANGQVWHPLKAEFIDTFEEELTTFPDCRYKDQVDTASQIIKYCFGSNISYPSGKV